LSCSDSEEIMSNQNSASALPEDFESWQRIEHPEWNRVIYTRPEGTPEPSVAPQPASPPPTTSATWRGWAAGALQWLTLLLAALRSE
jgi:hypothetical protein